MKWLCGQGTSTMGGSSISAIRSWLPRHVPSFWANFGYEIALRYSRASAIADVLFLTEVAGAPLYRFRS
jgi:hypothetical protein